MNKLRSIYENVSSPGSYGGVESLYIKVSRQQVEKWLSKELSYTLHNPVRKRFSRNKTIVFYIDELWQMDLCDTRVA